MTDIVSISSSGHIGLVDYDTVELNNLHRQLLHNETAVGVMKSESAKDTLSRYSHCILDKLLVWIY